jgi:hypothetical protein
MKRAVLSLSVIVGSLGPSAAFADDAQTMAEMQKKMNAEVMAKPFTVADQAKVDAYIDEAMKKNLKPKRQAPQHWTPGSSCQDLWQYSYNEYRDCAYYYRYYGHYW